MRVGAGVAEGCLTGEHSALASLMHGSPVGKACISPLHSTLGPPKRSVSAAEDTAEHCLRDPRIRVHGLCQICSLSPYAPSQHPCRDFAHLPRSAARFHYIGMIKTCRRVTGCARGPKSWRREGCRSGTLKGNIYMPLSPRTFWLTELRSTV